MSLKEHRKKIDSLDRKIVRLLNERTKHVLEIGALKKAAGEEIYAPHRELAVLERVCKLNEGPIRNDSLRAIYREIMSSALSLEKSMTIAYLGPEATFTHLAAIRRFGSSLRYAPQKTIADVFDKVTLGKADYGVVPVENTTEGVVTTTLDMFIETELKIVAQIVLPIQQCLVSSGPFDQIKRVYSHPQALAQCAKWMETHLPGAESIECSSTTRAAELSARDPGSGAISSFLAAERYNLNILFSDIQDNSKNATRFLVLGRQCSPPTGRDRTSLMLGIDHEAGALQRALEPMSRHKINVTIIQSRPNKEKAWEYYFFIDCEGHVEDRSLAKALVSLEKHCRLVRVLGSYPDSE